MSKRCLLDANVVLRFLVRDHPAHARAASRLFARAENGEVELVLTAWIVAEVVYALSGIYKLSRAEVANLLTAIVTAVGVVAENRASLLDALKRYASKTVDFADALMAAEALRMQVDIASFDRDLDKFSDIVRIEP